MILENKVNFEQHVMFIAAIRHKMYQLVGKASFKKYRIERPKYPNKYLLEVLEYPINICKTLMSEKKLGNVPNCSKIN